MRVGVGRNRFVPLAPPTRGPGLGGGSREPWYRLVFNEGCRAAPPAGGAPLGPGVTAMAKVEKAELVTAQVHKDELRSLFHLLVGKPDSTLKVFAGPFELSLSSIEDLDRQLVAKLDNHSIETDTTSATASFTDKTIKEFASLPQFCSHKWTGAERTEELTLKWDFLVSVPNFKVPHRHTLTFRAGRGLNPGEALALMFSKQPEDHEKLELASMPAYCRVDFVNPMLGRELINLVSEWHEGLKRPIIVSPWLRRLRDGRQWLRHIITYSLPLAAGLVCIGALRSLLSGLEPSAPATVAVLEAFGIWLALSSGGILIATLTGKVLGEKAEDQLSEIATGGITFALTNGDSNAVLAQVARNNRHVRNFCFASAWAIFLNVLAAYVAYRLGIGS